MSGLQMKYFILKPQGFEEHNHASRMALMAYADAVEDSSPDLAEDLKAWVEEARNEAITHWEDKP